MSSPSKRILYDIQELLTNGYDVEMDNDDMQEIYVQFKGPENSPYHGGVWRIRVELLDDYPYSSPSIGFVNKIYHPNIDEISGSVCLDVINQAWRSIFDLINVFKIFLPQLLLDPNPSDPLNGEAAALMNNDRTAYEQRVKEYCKKYAKAEDAGFAPEAKSSDASFAPEAKSSDEEPSVNEYASSDEEVAATRKLLEKLILDTVHT